MIDQVADEIKYILEDYEINGLVYLEQGTEQKLIESAGNPYDLGCMVGRIINYVDEIYDVENMKTDYENFHQGLKDTLDETFEVDSNEYDLSTRD